ncbi:MAG: hypothetical protein MUP66_02115 [Candidatus Nanohaloarchaeota archaeon QJJ-5]|nr:hypothetical protein [Candidatus Nanohaloarchaeota archaeon QJJ-5]
MSASPYDDGTMTEVTDPVDPAIYDDVDYDATTMEPEDLYETVEPFEYDQAQELFEASFEDALEAFEQDDVEEYIATVEDESLAVEYELDEEPDEQYPSIRVKVHEMPDGLFGWTDLNESSSQASVHVNSNVYDIDFEGTPSHEKTHRLHQGKDELTIRYINGDLDPENTLTMAHNGGRKWSYDAFMDGDY